MKRLLSLATLAALLALALGAPAAVQAGHPAAAGQRLVVFEGFYDSETPESQAAGAAVDRLATTYAARPVLFLEQTYQQSIGDRVNYFWAAQGPGFSYFPDMMVDSGRQISSGPVNYDQVYKQMVDTELARPPKADLQATQTRTGNDLRIDITLLNLSGETLSYLNDARIHAIVYENAKISLTHRFVRAEDHMNSGTIAPGGSAFYSLVFHDLNTLDWNRAGTVVMADYRPAGSTAYDMLQAVVPLSYNFSINPTAMTFLIDPAHPQDPVDSILTIGSPDVTWTATENIPWLTLDAASGPGGTPIVVHVTCSRLASGFQYGTLRVSAVSSLVQYDRDMPVTAYYGTVYHFQLPMIGRYPAGRW